MRRQTLYLDTSTISVYFQDESPERRDITRDFFENIVESGRYRALFSTVVLDEIERTPDPSKRNAMLELLRRGLPVSTDPVEEIRAVREAWNREVQGLPIGEAIALRLRAARETAERLISEGRILPEQLQPLRRTDVADPRAGRPGGSSPRIGEASASGGGPAGRQAPDPVDEIRAIRDADWEETKHLPLDQAIEFRLRAANETLRRLIAEGRVSPDRVVSIPSQPPKPPAVPNRT